MPRETPFHPRTSALCTSLRWKEWAGYHAVCAYEDCHEREVQALRHAAGVLDVTPLHKYEVTGPDAARLLARVTVRDVTRLAEGRVQYTCWCDDRGYVVDDGTVTRLGDEHFRLTAAEPSLSWLARHRRGLDVRIEDVTDSLAALAVQGPRARDVVRAVCDADLDALGFFRAARTTFAGGGAGVVTRTGYTGDLGYELWVPNADALALYDALLDQAPLHGVRPIGLDALDVTRLEAGFLLLGVDYQSSLGVTVDHRRSTPYELGLGWMVALDREPFTGRDALAAEEARGPQWSLVGLELDVTALERLYDEWGLPVELPHGTCRDSVPLYSGGRQVGYATSTAWSPTLKRFLALATVEAAYAAEGVALSYEVKVEHRRRAIPAVVAPTPFYDPPRKKA